MGLIIAAAVLKQFSSAIDNAVKIMGIESNATSREIHPPVAGACRFGQR